MTAKGLVAGRTMGQHQLQQESGSDDEDSEGPVDMAFACRHWGPPQVFVSITGVFFKVG